MRSWTKVGIGVAGGVVATAVAAGLVGVWRWGRDTEGAVARLTPNADAPPRGDMTGVAPYTESMLDGLPAPVARYFRFALVPGQRPIRLARLEQSGTFAIKPGAWVPFTAVEHMGTAPVAFVWDAKMRMLPVVPTLVRDSYLGGEGAMRASIAGVATMANVRGTPTMAQGALMRWLAEAVWIPTALLPGGGVTWQPIDDSTARATVRDGEVQATLDFHFAADGRITGTSGLRWRDDGTRAEQLPWKGSHDGYERVDGMMIPRVGEVGWETRDGYQGYWRGRQERVRYTF